MLLNVFTLSNSVKNIQSDLIIDNVIVKWLWAEIYTVCLYFVCFSLSPRLKFLLSDEKVLTGSRQ